MKKGRIQGIEPSGLKDLEHRLGDIMEIIDRETVQVKLEEAEKVILEDPSPTNLLRLGIIYHEAALNLNFLSKTGPKGYALKSFKLLDELFENEEIEKEMRPFITSYRASALSLVAAEKKSLILLGKAFDMFRQSVDDYAELIYLPEFLRGSVAENLPWIFFLKKRYAKKDFGSIISRYERDPSYANKKIMSFTYVAWAKQHRKQTHRDRISNFLNKAIALDPQFKAGRREAESLKVKLQL